ncbi:MAG: glycosyl transferase, family 2 [Aeromicrobium sp.]|jgi:putative flippase GtrA|nr:glycosyl transferase, family 2 [Aeromicrobium sp.]
MVVFAMIGIASTVVYAVLYVTLRGRLGSLKANAVALAASAIANTAANRRFTFGSVARPPLCATTCRDCWSSRAAWR